MTSSDWIAVVINGNRYEVALQADGHHAVIVLCQRRDTGLEYSRTIKYQSQNWKRAVRAAHNGLRNAGVTS